MFFNYDHVSRSFNYETYKYFIKSLVDKAQTTGPEQSEGRIISTRMGIHRIHRAEKQFHLTHPVKKQLKNITANMRWILIMESWCGDGSQVLPIIGGITNQSQNIDLRIILRDENDQLMHNFLTNGARAIPKLIAIHAESQMVVDTWGPRPAELQEAVMSLKRKDPDRFADKKEKMLHRWYAKDKGYSVQNELANKIELWNELLTSPDSEFPDDYGKFREFSEFARPKQTSKST